MLMLICIYLILTIIYLCRFFFFHYHMQNIESKKYEIVKEFGKGIF